MGFESLLGNTQLKENLRLSIGRGRTSHFYLISGPVGSGKHTLSKLLSAALLCVESEKPCLRCAACRKVMADTHPDVITVVDAEHKTVPVKMVRQARDDVYVRPNEGSHKIYIFPQEMNVEGQNSLLKVLEEPPAYGVFILLTDNPESLLTTVRSRCTELALQALPRDVLASRLQQQFPQAGEQEISAAIGRSGGYLGQALSLLEEGTELSDRTRAFAQSFRDKNSLGFAQLLASMEKSPRDQFLHTLKQWKALLQSALLYRSGVETTMAEAREIGTRRSPQEIMAAIRELEKAVDYTDHNVSTGAVCGYLMWTLQ